MPPPLWQHQHLPLAHHHTHFPFLPGTCEERVAFEADVWRGDGEEGGLVLREGSKVQGGCRSGRWVEMKGFGAD